MMPRGSCPAVHCLPWSCPAPHCQEPGKGQVPFDNFDLVKTWRTFRRKFEEEEGVLREVKVVKM